MIIIKIKGGLGNQLFQYAFGRYVSMQKKELLKIDMGNLVSNNDTARKYLLDNFNIKAEIATDEEIVKVKYPRRIFSKLSRFFCSKIFRIHNIGYVPNIRQTNNRYYEGFWQSYKYLEPIKDILLKEITLIKPIGIKYPDLLTQVDSTNSVSIHVRRGDYINDSKTKADHLTFGLEYYMNAIKIISNKLDNPAFFIFSDDIDWVKENLKIDFPTVFVSNPGIKDYEELIIMSRCKHDIIANSSFSFWGAWLNQNPEKIVIAPKKWNNRYQADYKDLLPETWTKI